MNRKQEYENLGYDVNVPGSKVRVYVEADSVNFEVGLPIEIVSPDGERAVLEDYFSTLIKTSQVDLSVDSSGKTTAPTTLVSPDNEKFIAFIPEVLKQVLFQ